MQARGRVSIGEHVAERDDSPLGPQPNQPAQAAFCTTEPHPTASASAGSDGQSGKASSSVNLLETVSPSRSLLDYCWSPTPPAETYQLVSRFGHAHFEDLQTRCRAQDSS